MAAYYGPVGGVRQEDIVGASRKIAESRDTDDISTGQLGSACNQWQKPVSEFGGTNHQWVVNLKSSSYVGEIDFGRREWARARDAVDAVMDLLLKEMRNKASGYEGLRIDSYIRQGSSRDGLKVIKPDEFDTVIEFHIEGLAFSQESIYKNGRSVPGFCYLRVQQTPETLKIKYPKLWRDEVFRVEGHGSVYLSSRMLHQSVFESIIDQSIRDIKMQVNAMRGSGQVNFQITRRMNPPAVNITIHLDDDANELFMRQGQMRSRTDDIRDIDLDIVPAIRLRIDRDTTYKGSPVNAIIHAVCKWKEEEASRSLEFVDQMLVWHINSAGYERYILDVARTNQKQKYILTALRILKTYFTRTNQVAKQENRPPPPITTILKSYHLKQLAFYMILYSCHVHPFIQIDGTEKALGCLLDMLETALEKKHLSHFFYSNSQIRSILQNYPITSGALRFDLFRKIPNESLRQAQLSCENHLLKDLGFSKGGGDGDIATLISSFSAELSHGDYF